VKVAMKGLRVLDSYAIAGVMYLITVILLSRILAYVEARLRIPGLSIEERGR